MSWSKPASRPRLLSTALLLAALLSACSSAGGAQGASHGTQGNGSQGPHRGGKLVMAQGQDIVSPAPWPSTLSRHSVLRALYSTPWRLDRSGKPQPDLAETWEISKDMKSVTLHLRKGVKFHNGRELTADDIVWTIGWTRDPKTNAQIAPMLKTATATAVDKYTVRISWPEPANHMLDTLNELFVVAEESVPQIDRKPIGTGPFKVGDYVPGQVLKLIHNDQYFVSGLPYLDEVDIQMLPDPQSMLSALQGGTADMVRQPPSQDLNQLKQSGFQVLVSTQASNTLAYAFDVTRPPFNDPRVLQAINYAIDRDRIVKTALFGNGKLMCIPWPEGSLGYDAQLNQACRFDLNKAKSLLDQAGVHDLAFNLLISSESFPEHTRIAQIVQADLAKIGVKVTLRDVDGAQWTSTIQVGKFPPDVPMAVFLYGKANLDPMMLFTTAPFRVNGNVSHFTDPEYGRLVNAAAIEVDQAKRATLYHQLDQLFLDKAFMLPLSPLGRQWAMQSYVKGFEIDANDRELFEQAWLAK